jgi:hypothetical protein
VTATTVYTVTASNSAGFTTAPVTITVSVAPPAGLVYSSPTAYYTVGVPIPENVPSNTGGAPTTFGVKPNVTYAYSVTPALPAGLNLSTFTPPYDPDPPTISAGVISGTPSVLATLGTSTYTVTASNPAGYTTATLTITVNAASANLAPAGLAYSTPAPVYVAGVPITQNAPLPSITGEAPITYSVSPALPAGLTFSASTGAIGGTPAAPSSTIVPPPRPTRPTTR